MDSRRLVADIVGRRKQFIGSAFLVGMSMVLAAVVAYRLQMRGAIMRRLSAGLSSPVPADPFAIGLDRQPGVVH
jgi:hypothetical protein